MRDEKINEYQVLIYGKANIEQAIEGKDVVLVVHGTVQKVEDEDNDNGTFNRTYKVKQVEVAINK